MKEIHKASKPKINLLLLFVFCLQIIAMGAPIAGFMSHKLKMNDLASCILPLSFLYILISNRISLKNAKNLWIVYAIIAVLQIMVFIKWGTGNVLISAFYDVTIAFILARTLGIRKFLWYFEHSVTILTFISLIFWVSVILFPGVSNILRSIAFPPYTDNIDFTIGVFGRPNAEGHLYRNNGFAWEPGRFASIIVLTMLINLFRNRFRFNNRNFWILMGGLISTFSTTGFMAFAVCIIGINLNYKKRGILKWTKYIIVGGFLIFLIASPFMYEKIISTADSDNWLGEAGAARRAEKGIAYTPQRLEGLFLEFMNILDSPLIGYGENPDLSYVKRELFPFVELYLSNGIFQIASRLGIPLALLFYICLWKSSCVLAQLYQVRGKYLFFLMIILINVSYNFFIEPLVIFISLCSIFISNKERTLVYQDYAPTVNCRSDL